MNKATKFWIYFIFKKIISSAYILKMNEVTDAAYFGRIYFQEDNLQ